MQSPKGLLKILQKEIDTITSEKVGILLSGGIDSTILAYLLKHANKDIIAVTIGSYFNHPDITAAIKTTEQHNIEHIIYIPNDETILKASFSSKKKSRL